MKAKDVVFIKDVTKRVSGQGNPYFVIDFIEKLQQQDEEGNPVTKEWNNVFYAAKEDQTNPNNFKGQNAVIIINFYTYNRKVGDKVYTDLKANILDMQPVEVGQEK